MAGGFWFDISELAVDRAEKYSDDPYLKASGQIVFGELDKKTLVDYPLQLIYEQLRS